MKEYELIYKGPMFEDQSIIPYKYCDAYFGLEIDAESDLFYENRFENHILPYRLYDSSEKELAEIKNFFTVNRNTFYFLFHERDSFIGSVLWLKNYIQSIIVIKEFQRKGYGEKLAKFAVNNILKNGFNEIRLNVLFGNENALKLYQKMGFWINEK
jgi:ribosomal protein S18 acetylase RimI-like enzyme